MAGGSVGERLLSRGWLVPGAAVFGVALVLRLLYLAEIHSIPFLEFPVNDAREYDLWARQIAAGDWWGSEVFYQAPAYPYFLAVIYLLFGEDLWAVHVLQMIVGASSCVLLFLGTRPLFGERAALAAGLGLALYPPAWFFDGVLGKSVLALFLLCGLLALLLHFQARPRGSLALAAGAVLGVLALTRENTLAFGLAIPLWLAARFAREAGRDCVRWILAFLCGLVLVLGAVGARNYAVGGSFVLTTSQLGTNFYIGNNPEATGLYRPLVPGRNTPTYEASDAANLAEKAVGRPLSRSDVSSYWLSRGLAFVVAEPGAFLRLLWIKTLYTWNAFEIADTEDLYVYDDWSRLLAGGIRLFHFGILAPLAAAGLALTWRRRRDSGVLLWLAFVYSAAVALFIAFARFRLPLVPLLMPFAGAAVVESVAHVRSGQWRALAAPALAFVALALVTNLQLLDEERMQGASYTNLAGIMLNLRREADAEPFLREAERRLPESPEVQFHIAVFHFRRGGFQEAEAHLRRMLDAAPDDVRGYRLLAASLRRQGRLAEAEAAKRRAAEVDPDRGVRHAPKANRPRVAPRPVEDREDTVEDRKDALEDGND